MDLKDRSDNEAVRSRGQDLVSTVLLLVYHSLFIYFNNSSIIMVITVIIIPCTTDGVTTLPLALPSEAGCHTLFDHFVVRMPRSLVRLHFFVFCTATDTVTASIGICLLYTSPSPRD